MIKNVSDFIPVALREIGALWSNFLSFLTDSYTYYKNKIMGLRSEYIAEETTNAVELAYNVGAYIIPGDSVDTVKKKAGNAFKTHKKLPVFDDVYKPIIDGITGGNSSIYQGALYYGSFIVGQSIVGSPALIGIVVFPGGVVAAKQKGEIYIDLEVTPTDDEIQEIINQLRPLVPVYFRVYIGIKQEITSDVFLVGSSLVGGYDLIGGPVASYVIFNVIARIV